jgi:ATP-dependent helicase/nuclease subunit B
LEEFVKNPSGTKLHKIFDEYFLSEEAKLIWWPKFENIFSDFKEKNESFFGLVNHLEMPVKLQLEEVLISGKIDRIICNNEGNAEIFDYKTGQVPSKKDVISGSNPQLTIAALALVEEMAIESLNYWKLSSSKSGEIKKICDKNEEMQILLSATKAGLTKLFEYFAKEGNGYIATKNSEYNEYKHLSRNAF